MKHVYISHPFRGDKLANVLDTTKICTELSEKYLDVLPVSPLHIFSYITDNDQAMRYDLELLKMCDELWAYGDFMHSEGCMAEIDYALKHSIPVKVCLGGKLVKVCRNEVCLQKE